MALIQSVQATQKHNVMYRYQCENCGKNSGWLTKEFIGQGEIPAGEIATDANGRLSEDGMAKAQREAMEAAAASLCKTIRYAVDDVKRERYTGFNGVCPHCSAPQTWYVRHSFSRAITDSLIMAIGLPIIPLVLMGVYESDYFYWALWSPVVLFLLSFVCLSIRCLIMKRQVCNVVNPQKPFINWGGAGQCDRNLHM